MATISTVLNPLSGANTFIQLLSDVDTIKTLAPLATDTLDNADLANTNAYIASVDSQRASDLANTNSYIASVQSTERSALANTNAYIASVDSQRASDLANTNAYIASATSGSVTLGKVIAMQIVFG